MLAAFHQSISAVILAKYPKLLIKQMRFCDCDEVSKVFTSKLIKRGQKGIILVFLTVWM